MEIIQGLGITTATTFLRSDRLSINPGFVAIAATAATLFDAAIIDPGSAQSTHTS